MGTNSSLGDYGMGVDGVGGVFPVYYLSFLSIVPFQINASFNISEIFLKIFHFSEFLKISQNFSFLNIYYCENTWLHGDYKKVTLEFQINIKGSMIFEWMKNIHT